MPAKAFAPSTNELHSDRLEQEIAWEHAAKMLDLDRSLARKLRSPGIEWTTHCECESGVASLYGAATGIGSETYATVLVGNHVGPAQVTEQVCELRMQIALAKIDKQAGAIGLHIPSGKISEQELFDLACACAPWVTRVLGATRLLPCDLLPTAFANWMAAAAAPYGSRLQAPLIEPEAYLRSESRIFAAIIAQIAGLALGERGKKLRSTRVTVVGLDALGRECLKLLQETGAHIVAVADESGGLMQETGIEVPQFLLHIESGGLGAEYSGAQHIAHAETLAMPTDLMLVGGRAAEIMDCNAASVTAPVIVETASGSVSRAAQEELSTRGAIVVPQVMIRTCRLTESVDLLWSELCAVCKTHACSLPTAMLVSSLQRLAEKERAARP